MTTHNPEVAGGAPKVLWRHERYAPSVASPIVYDNVLYSLRTGGILTALKMHEGGVLKEGRIAGFGGQIFASPIAADGKLFLLNYAGDVAVLRPAADWKVLAVNSLDEPAYATPAVVNRKLLVRTARFLYCFSEKEVQPVGTVSH